MASRRTGPFQWSNSDPEREARKAEGTGADPDRSEAPRCGSDPYPSGYAPYTPCPPASRQSLSDLGLSREVGFYIYGMRVAVEGKRLKPPYDLAFRLQYANGMPVGHPGGGLHGWGWMHTLESAKCAMPRFASRDDAANDLLCFLQAGAEARGEDCLITICMPGGGRDITVSIGGHYGTAQEFPRAACNAALKYQDALNEMGPPRPHVQRREVGMKGTACVQCGANVDQQRQLPCRGTTTIDEALAAEARWMASKEKKETL